MSSPGASSLGAPVLLGISLKLYLDVRRSERWARAVAELARGHDAIRSGAVELFAMPALPALTRVGAALAGSPVRLGAQDLFWEDRGPYTGGTSGADLRDVGCTLVEVGHAERRTHFGETDDMVRAKVAAAFRNDLVPVLCVGEPAQGPAGAAARECVRQVDSALGDAGRRGAAAGLVVAYEPQWAIGRSEPASADHVRAVAQALRDRLDAAPGVGRAQVIYGGSAQSGTLTDLRGSVDGLFLGRFAHDPAELERIVDEAATIG